MTNKEIIKECRKLTKAQGLEFKRSKTIGTINAMACYEIHSGLFYKVLHQGNLNTIYETLLSENLKGQ